MPTELFSPARAAVLGGVCRQTLAAWLKAGLIQPRYSWTNKLRARATPLFSAEDVEVLRALRRDRAARMKALKLPGRPLAG